MTFVTPYMSGSEGVTVPLLSSRFIISSRARSTRFDRRRVCAPTSRLRKLVPKSRQCTGHLPLSQNCSLPVFPSVHSRRVAANCFSQRRKITSSITQSGDWEMTKQEVAILSTKDGCIVGFGGLHSDMTSGIPKARLARQRWPRLPREQQLVVQCTGACVGPKAVEGYSLYATVMPSLFRSIAICTLRANADLLAAWRDSSLVNSSWSICGSIESWTAVAKEFIYSPTSRWVQTCCIAPSLQDFRGFELLMKTAVRTLESGRHSTWLARC